MPDMQKLQENKERILSIIRSSGPSFPARISGETGISPLFVSALLSELVSEKRLKLSNMKIGSSPLYFAEGQESQLENFIDCLNSKEKEAFNLLKQSEILEDQKQTPQIRVTLRGLKDFAIPITAKAGNETKLFWKFFSLPNSQIKSKIQESLTQKPKKAEKQKLKLESEPKKQPILETQLINKPKEKTKTQNSEFANLIKDYLSAKDIEILEELSAKKREFISKIRLNETLGKQEYYLTSKDKKKITENDLMLAHQHAQANKMPAFIISPGELDKKAKAYLQQWRNLVKFERIKL